MDEEELKEIAKRGLSLLRVNSETWEELEETRGGGSRFSLTFPHDMAKGARRNSLLLIVIDGDRHELRVGLVSSRQAVSTFDSRVNFDLVRLISPSTLQELLKPLTTTSLGYLATKLADGNVEFQSVSPKLGERITELIRNDTKNATALRPIIARLGLPKQFRNARALQQDAITMALRAFGVVDGAVEVALPGDTGLGAVRLQEDAVIEHDARSIPGWDLVNSYVTGRAVFKRGDAQLAVYTANKRPLEELLGVDLIYLNERRGCLVMVQYKMMEKSGQAHDDAEHVSDDETDEVEWTVRVDSQFEAEIQRMLVFDTDLSPEGPYRLNSGAFFVKLVKRYALTTTAAIVLSLGHLKQLIDDGQITGPMGGLRISYRGLDGHYLHSDPFIELIRSGYVGTRGATTENLRSLIEAAMKGGRAVVAAIQSTIRPN